MNQDSKTLQNINPRNLKPGMYVIIPASWLNHPFLKRQFVIKSQEQIDKIITCGFDNVIIDTSKGTYDSSLTGINDETELDHTKENNDGKSSESLENTDIIEAVNTISHGDTGLPAPEKWDPDKFVSEELRNAIHDKSLNPSRKSEAVYKFSLEIMNKLLNSPTAENIQAGKNHIYEVVDVILADNETADCLLNITSHDFYTYTHSVNVGILSILLSKVLIKEYTEEQMRELGAGFFLHDLGKVHVEPSIINKPARLTKEEMFKIRTHPYQGYLLLKETNQLTEDCQIIVMQHHEREDGTGYPRRLIGDEIHLYGRICCIADVFDALTAERSYKPKLTPFEALKIMKEEMINHFHKEIFMEFVLLFKSKN